MSDELKAGLALLRAPFPPHQISKLPKATCKKAEYDQLPKGSCQECGGYHATSRTIHLSYVGHAALTDRLLDVDLSWTWEPLAYTEHGLPRFDATGGLWIKLTVLGMTRLGYGQAEAKSWSDIGAREKEIIGDALRNAAMRFGAALDLWHKGELHVDDADEAPASSAADPAPAARKEPAAEPRTGDTGGATITPPQLRILLKALERKGLAEHTLTDAFGIAALNQLPAASINDAIAWVSSQKAEDTPERDDDEAGDRI